MKVLGLTLLLALGFPDGPKADFYQDFRGKVPNKSFFRYHGGQNPAQYIKSEPEGLRVTLPEKREKPAGLVTTFPIKGDFEITTGYELLKTDVPAAGRVGFMFYIMTETPTEEALSVFRLVRGKGGDAYYISQRTTTKEGRLSKSEYHPAAGKSGRLRLIRVKGEVAFHVAEGDTDDFKELFRYEIGPEDVKRVELAAYPGQTQAAVDIRIKDFRLRAPEMPKQDLAEAPREDIEPPPRGKTLWVLAGLSGGGLLLGGAWVFWRRLRGAPKQETPPAPPPRRPTRA